MLSLLLLQFRVPAQNPIKFYHISSFCSHGLIAIIAVKLNIYEMNKLIQYKKTPSNHLDGVKSE